MTQLALGDEYAESVVRRRPGRRTIRLGWLTLEEFQACLDLDACRAMYEEARRHLGEMPCKRMSWPPKECAKPKVHQTCGCPCYSFRSCKDPDCDHPACGREVDTRFRDAFQARFPVFDNIDVYTGRSEPRPLGKPALYYRGFAAIVREARVEPNLDLAKRMWNRLTEDWVDLHDLGVDSEKLLSGEIGMWKLKLPVQISDAYYAVPFWAALALVKGEDPKGGNHQEIRRKPGSKDRQL